MSDSKKSGLNVWMLVSIVAIVIAVFAVLTSMSHESRLATQEEGIANVTGILKNQTMMFQNQIAFNKAVSVWAFNVTDTIMKLEAKP